MLEGMNIVDNASEIIIKYLPFATGVVVNIVIIYIINKIIDISQKNIANNIQKMNSDSPLLSLMPILSKIVKITIIFLLLAGFLQSFGYNVTSLVAGFGITGLAVGFAAKEAIGNVFGSIGLLADRVYKVGDYIKFNGMEGYVEGVNLRSTLIRTMDDFLINVPNNQLANEEIINVSQCKKRKIDILIDIEYGTTNEQIDKGLEILSNIAQNHPKILDGYFTNIETMDSSSIVLRLFSYTSETSWVSYKKIKSEIFKEIIVKFREENINFAFPSTSVYIEKS